MQEEEKLEMTIGLQNIVIPEIDLTNFSLARLGNALQSINSLQDLPNKGSLNIGFAAAAAIGLDRSRILLQKQKKSSK